MAINSLSNNLYQILSDDNNTNDECFSKGLLSGEVYGVAYPLVQSFSILTRVQKVIPIIKNIFSKENK